MLDGAPDAVAEGQLEGEPADQEVDDAVRDQAGRRPVDPVAVLGCGGALGASGEIGRARSRWPGGRSGRRRSWS